MENANDFLREYTGTEHYYKHLFGMLYTDGVRELAERFECYWLLDLIASYWPILRHNSFQVWQITVNADGSACATCTDGNNRVLVRQNIPYTDLRAEATIWVEHGVLLLPSEH